MELVRRWSTPTLIFYIISAILISFLFNVGIKNEKKIIKIGRYSFKYQSIIAIIIFIILMFISCFRTIGPLVGGIDARTYINAFLYDSYVKFDIFKILKMQGTEPLFYNLMTFIRGFTDNRYILFIIIYSIIYIPMIRFVFDNAEGNKSSAYILFFLMYLYSFNLIRNIFAISLALIAITKIKNNKYFSFIIFILLSYLSHFSCIIFLAYGVFYKIFEKKWNNFKQIIRWSLFFMILLTSSYMVLKSFALTTKYAGYLDNDISLLGYIPIAILLIIMIIYHRQLLTKKEDWFIYSLVLFNVIILPISILGRAASRVLICFMLPRILMWGKIENMLLKNNNNKIKFLICIISFFIFSGWFGFKYSSDGWRAHGLSPYYNDVIQYLINDY